MSTLEDQRLEKSMPGRWAEVNIYCLPVYTLLALLSKVDGLTRTLQRVVLYLNFI